MEERNPINSGRRIASIQRNKTKDIFLEDAKIIPLKVSLSVYNASKGTYMAKTGYKKNPYYIFVNNTNRYKSVLLIVQNKCEADIK